MNILICVPAIIIGDLWQLPDYQMQNLLKCRDSVDSKSLITDNLFNSGLMLMATGIYTGLVFRFKVLHPVYHIDCFKDEPIFTWRVIIFKLVFIGACCVPWFLLG